MTRRRYTYREVVGIVAGQMGIWEHPGGAVFGIKCPICKAPISQSQIPDCDLDHGIARGLSEPGHEREKDDPANVAVVHGPCHRRKTADDKRRMAKADRQGGTKTGQRARRERRNEMDEILEEQGKRVRPLWPKGRKMQSRPMERRKT